jgi:hypothetical protein
MAVPSLTRGCERQDGFVDRNEAPSTWENIMKGFLPVFAVLVSSGCMASTSVNSMAAPNTSGVTYHRILVNFSTGDLGWRKTAEDAFVAKDPSFIASYTVFFPGRTYTQDEIAAAYMQNHLDAALVISNSASGVSTYTTPAQTSTTCGAAANGVAVAAACGTSETAGSSYEKPWATFTAQMWNARTGEVVWMASSSTGGNAFANWHSVLSSMVRSTVSKLRQDRVISSEHM